MGELDGKVALITGAGSGMGRASVEVFVREGARVLAVDITGAQDETAADVGDAVVPFQCDVSDEAQVEAAFAAAVEAFGRVDIVCNVAGIADGMPLADITMEHYDRIMDVNLRGVVLGTKHALRTMLPTGGGVILNWSSTGGLNGSRMPTTAYSASKAGVIAVTKQAAIEYGEQGIRANTLCPGFVETAMSGGKGAAERFPQLVGGTALKRGGQPEEVAEVASFLASDRASLVTGITVPIDGGLTAVQA
ncbi:MAG: SDR family oxidoreductase [Actinomycetota bacterium]|nr:SDR family oxidoreductase [Actinomycetota bacterium]